MSDIFDKIFTRSISEDEYRKIAAMLYDKKLLPMITDLSEQEIKDISKTRFYDDYMKKNWGVDIDLTSFVVWITMYKISRKRLGRREHVELWKGELMQEETTASKARKMLGIR